MSADNWGICPRCNAKALEANNAAKLKAGLLYGKVPPEEYLKLLASAEGPPEVDDTLREDYEIGTDLHGEFYISYSCSCSECGFKYNFKHSEKLPMKTSGTHLGNQRNGFRDGSTVHPDDLSKPKFVGAPQVKAGEHPLVMSCGLCLSTISLPVTNGQARLSDAAGWEFNGESGLNWRCPKCSAGNGNGDAA